MESKKDINQEIIDLTTKIIIQYPELTKYMEELNTSIPDTGQLTIKDLEDYRNTLDAMVKKYKKEHNAD